MVKIDLNSDLGESFGAYTIGLDGDILPYITSSNIACGYHAGDPLVMEKTVKLCKEKGVAVGAHPGYPDLMGFGRRNMAASPKEVAAYIKYQVGALLAFCTSHGVKMQHVKPHGALYNTAAKDYELSRAIAEAIYSIDNSLILLGLSGSEMLRAAQDIGLPCASEVFADRAYNEDGSLVARGTPGAMIKDVDECAQRIVRMVKENKVTAITGKDITLAPQSICVHGDTPEAVQFVENIRKQLEQNDIQLANLAEIL